MRILVITIALSFCLIQQNCQVSQRKFDPSKAEEEIKRLYALEEQLVLHQDTAGFRKFYPNDFVVTNPFNQFINKNTVIERVKENIIKYSSYKRTFDAFQFYGNTAVVIGSEIVEGSWQKVVRHASNIIE